MFNASRSPCSEAPALRTESVQNGGSLGHALQEGDDVLHRELGILVLGTVPRSVIAFFNPPGIERLNSGVTKSTASTAAMASLTAVATGGSCDRSRSYTTGDP